MWPFSPPMWGVSRTGRAESFRGGRIYLVFLPHFSSKDDRYDHFKASYRFIPKTGMFTDGPVASFCVIMDALR